MTLTFTILFLERSCKWDRKYNSQEKECPHLVTDWESIQLSLYRPTCKYIVDRLKWTPKSQRYIFLFWKSVYFLAPFILFWQNVLTKDGSNLETLSGPQLFCLTGHKQMHTVVDLYRCILLRRHYDQTFYELLLSIWRYMYHPIWFSVCMHTPLHLWSNKRQETPTNEIRIHCLND
jgi:hypothetical protein